MIDQNIFENTIDFTGVKVLLYVNDNHAIFEQRDGKGAFPFLIDLIGGGRENNESPLENMIREVYEETGLNVHSSDIIQAHIRQSLADETRMAFFFVVKVEESLHSITFGNEGLGLVILDPQVFIELDNGVKGQQIKVRDYLTSKTV